MGDFAFTSQDPAGDTGYPEFIQPSIYTRGDALEDLDSDSEMWNIYLNEVKDEDNRIISAWKEDANSIVTFTGLFSAIVGGFIIEFYKKLSSDSGDQTVALLQQISHQLPNFPNSTNSNTANQPSSSPGTVMIWVITLWLISLVLSLTCALIATLLQQWARRYIETPKSSNVQRHRARVRSLLLVGTKLYKIPLIVGIIPTLLHISVYLFLAGLVITFHTINKKVAIAVDVAVGVSGLAYLVLSILPCLDPRCPYRTPISQMLWYPCHAFLSVAAPFLDRCILGLRELLNQPAQTGRLSVSHHWQYFAYGLEKSIVNRAVETLKDSDRGRVTRLFNQLALGDRNKFLKFAASIPRHKIVDLILPIDSVLLRGSLLALLRSAAAGKGGETDVNRRSLLLGLHVVRHIVKAPIPDSDLDFMRTHFANIDFMEYLFEDENIAIKVTSRSICSLLAKQVVRNPLRGPQLRWLGDVIGHVSNTTDVATWDRRNLKSFIYEVLADQEIDLPTEDAASFKETLAILLDVRTDDDFETNFQSRLSAEVQRMRGPEIDGEVFQNLCSIFPFLRSSRPASASHAASTSGDSTSVSGDSASTRAASSTAPVVSSPAASASAVRTSTHASLTRGGSTPVTADSASTHAASPAASSHAASSHAVLTRGGSTPVTADSASTRAASSLASGRAASPAASSQESSSYAVLTRGGSTPVTADSASTRAASSLASARGASSHTASASGTSSAASLHGDPLAQV